MEQLPPGFRFHPTDRELITHYLAKKASDATFDPTAIGVVDLNKVEPWDLPWRAKMGEKEWYFFCVRDRKYPTGLRTNRATESGYWKATGKDKDIRDGKTLIGMKKTLVFYRGRAPKGEKTGWVMHEYRLDGHLPDTAKNEWVIGRVFKKSEVATSDSGAAHVTCFSNDVAEEYSLALPVLPASCPGDQKYGLGNMDDQYWSGVQLMQSGYGMEKHRVMSNVTTQETGVTTTTHLNTEISSVLPSNAYCFWGY